MKFRLNSINGCQGTERTRNSIANDQREITPKIYKAELWFLYMTHRLIVLYNCMKFHSNSFNSCQLTERKRNRIANDQREITPKICGRNPSNRTQYSARFREYSVRRGMVRSIQHLRQIVGVFIKQTEYG